MSDELKPCPFCGAPAGEIQHAHAPQIQADGSVYETRFIQCSNERPSGAPKLGIYDVCHGQGAFASSEPGAIAAWNTRAEVAKPVVKMPRVHAHQYVSDGFYFDHDEMLAALKAAGVGVVP